MKKITVILMAIFGILPMSGCGLWNALFPRKSYKEQVAERLGLNLENTTVLEEWDTHGGFHGDGEMFLKLSCADGFEECLKQQWKKMPLVDEAYSYYYIWGGLFEHPETGKKVIPEIANGYWYFENTGAMNWDFAAYDCEENILYFYGFDA